MSSIKYLSLAVGKLLKELPEFFVLDSCGIEDADNQRLSSPVRHRDPGTARPMEGVALRVLADGRDAAAGGNLLDIGNDAGNNLVKPASAAGGRRHKCEACLRTNGANILA